MSMLKDTLIRLTGNQTAQNFLEKLVAKGQLLMGIDSGASVESSGEKAILNWITQGSHPPYCIFDVGSNQGQYLDLALRAFPKHDLSIHCFEPSAHTFQLLSAKKKNEQHKIILNNLALGRKEAVLELFYDNPGSGLASLTKRQLGHLDIVFDKSEQVKVDTVDNYCRQRKIEKIHLLKLDVEGHELDVLAGAADMFQKRAIDSVTFEFGGCNIDTRTFLRDFFYFFKNQNMSISRITPTGYLHDLGSYKEVFEQFRTTNFVAIKKKQLAPLS